MMIASLKVRKLGGSLGIVIPQIIARQIGLEVGKRIQIAWTHDTITLKPYPQELTNLLDMSDDEFNVEDI